MKYKLLTFLCIYGLAASAPAAAREEIRMVGSSTVYPFVTVVAENFGQKTKHPTPIVEATGTGGGFKLFCSGVDESTPDVANASRAIKESEKALCAEHGVTEMTELKIGYDGIVVANLASQDKISLTREQLFLALAKHVPVDGKLIENPYNTWHDLDETLPDVAISVYGPPPTSGTRDAFVELVMDYACEPIVEFEQAYPDEKERKKACGLMREDGKFIEAGENDNLIVQKLKANEHSFGIFGYSFLEMNSELIQAAAVDGVEPSFEAIMDGTYSVSRPLFVYIKNAHTSKISGLKEFAEELVSEAAIGEEGYVIDKGLIPLPAEELKQQQERAAGL